MAKSKLNIYELINNYDEDYINSISLSNIKSAKELSALLTNLEKANYVVTNFYQTLYSDYIMSINSDHTLSDNAPTIESIKKYKSIANRIQKAYSYISYINSFENPFKSSKSR